MTKSEARRLLDDLSPKQLEVLELLCRHLTTKEIAHALALAPNTIDQRIGAIRDKWGTTNRKETLRLYQSAVEACEKPTYELSSVDGLILAGHEHPKDLGDHPSAISDRLPIPSDAFNEPHREFALHGLDVRLGQPGRALMVFVTAMLIALTIVAALTIMEALSRML